MDSQTLENPGWNMNIKETPEISFRCPRNHWALVIRIGWTRRVILRSPDGVYGHSLDMEDRQNQPICRVYSVPVSSLRAKTFSLWKCQFANILRDLDVPPPKRLEYADRIVRYAQNTADRCRGRGPFMLEADLTSSIVLDAYDADTLLIPEEEHEPIGRGVSREVIPRLLQCAKKGRDPAGADPDACSICLNNMIGEDELVGMPCKHMFHGPCIIRWFETSKSCPLCRYILDD